MESALVVELGQTVGEQEARKKPDSYRGISPMGDANAKWMSGEWKPILP